MKAVKKLKNDVDIIIVLDKSGSMESRFSETIGGFNSFLSEQKKIQGNAFLTLVQFDNLYELNYKRIPIQNVVDLDKENYRPRGMTRLFDAVGKTINEMKNEMKNDTVFLLITDGMENDSKEYDAESIKKLIEKCKTSKNHWEFVFMGCDESIFSDAGKIGISKSNTITTVSIKKGYDSFSQKMSNYRTGVSDIQNSFTYCDSDREDLNKE